MMITVYLSQAILCIAAQCWPVLIGPSTPIGEFTLTQRITADSGYGGNVLQFDETSTEVLAIHRLWLLRPSEQRERRIAQKDPKNRRVTKGCINVDNLLYDYLLANHQGSQLKILP